MVSNIKTEKLEIRLIMSYWKSINLWVLRSRKAWLGWDQPKWNYWKMGSVRLMMLILPVLKIKGHLVKIKLLSNQVANKRNQEEKKIKVKLWNVNFVTDQISLSLRMKTWTCTSGRTAWCLLNANIAVRLLKLKLITNIYSRSVIRLQISSNALDAKRV